MVEVAGRHGHARAIAVITGLRHDRHGAGIVVPLQIAPHLIVVVSQSVRVRIGGGIEQQASGFDGATRHDHRRGRGDVAFAPHEVCHAGGAVPRINQHAFGLRLCDQLTAAVASARGIAVLCVPFLPSDGQAKPTHMPHCTQAGRPLKGVVLISSGGGNAVMPSAAAPAVSSARCGLVGTAGIG